MWRGKSARTADTCSYLSLRDWNLSLYVNLCRWLAFGSKAGLMSWSCCICWWEREWWEADLRGCFEDESDRTWTG